MRILNENFMGDLQSGKLKPLLEFVRNDNTLDLQIRNGYINIYYRGGNLLKLEQKANNKYYSASFDKEYYEKLKLLHKDLIDPTLDPTSDLPKCISNEEDAKKWIGKFPLLKQIMNYYFTTKENKLEGEFEQLIVRENNYTPKMSNETDYFIIDTQYQNQIPNKCRFDLIALYWASGDRKQPKGKCTLAFIEIKYGNQALRGESGLEEHIKDLNDFIGNNDNFKTFKEEMIRLFKQKRDLELINFGKNKPAEINDSSLTKDPEVILLLINYNPRSKALIEVIKNIKETKDLKFKLKFATANFMGYGLYKEGIYNVEEFEEKFIK